MAEMESILGSIRKLIGGVDDSDGPFDADLILHINSVFDIVNQLGVGPEEPFHIVGDTETWADFFGATKVVNMVKSYMYLKTKLLFDAPTTGVLHEAMERQIQEFEWRLQVSGHSDEYQEEVTPEYGQRSK